MEIKEIILYVVFIIAGYFIGSLSPAVFLSKKVAGIDIRDKGSKNAGSTNVYRVMGAKWGIINFVADILKGLLPTLIALYIARALNGAYDGWMGASIAAGSVLLGHAFPIFNHFKGGKCVASMTGAMFAFAPIPTLILLAIAIVLIVVTRLVSLASILAYTIVMICSWALGDMLNFVLPQQIFMTVFPLLIIYLHKENIKRLIKGEESKLDIHKKSEY